MNNYHYAGPFIPDYNSGAIFNGTTTIQSFQLKNYGPNGPTSVRFVNMSSTNIVAVAIMNQTPLNIINAYGFIDIPPKGTAIVGKDPNINTLWVLSRVGPADVHVIFGEKGV